MIFYPLSLSLTHWHGDNDGSISVSKADLYVAILSFNYCVVSCWLRGSECRAVHRAARVDTFAKRFAANRLLTSPIARPPTVVRADDTTSQRSTQNQSIAGVDSAFSWQSLQASFVLWSRVNHQCLNFACSSEAPTGGSVLGAVTYHCQTTWSGVLLISSLLRGGGFRSEILLVTSPVRFKTSDAYPFSRLTGLEGVRWFRSSFKKPARFTFISSEFDTRRQLSEHA